MSLKLETKKEKFTTPLYLESGRILEPYEIAYETYGELNDDKSNVIVICHALSGSHHAAGRYEGERKAGWWDGLIGPGKPVDTDKHFVICTNTIGSCFGSTGPSSPTYPSRQPYRFTFPVITVKDMVKAQRMLFNRLGIHKVKAVIGGSMGGMQALHYAIDFPGFADRVIAMAATHATGPWAVSFNKVAAEAIINDPEFKNGEYDFDHVRENGLVGAAIGRMAGHISFLSPESMDRKFGREYVQDDGIFDLFGRYQVERYLDYNGGNFPRWFDPLTFLYIAKAINIFDLSRGHDSLVDAMKNLRGDLHLFGFSRDLLFPPSEMEEIRKAADAAGKGEQCYYYPIESDYGHDAFLVEIDKFAQVVADLLEAP